jgi:hypothetical protein
MAPTLGENWPARLPKEADWDREGAPPTSAEAIKTLQEFSVVPCSSGGLQLEVHRDGFDIEIVIRADGRIESAWVCIEPK